MRRSHRMSRREFVKTTAVAAGALAVGTTALAQEGKSRVVIARNEAVTKGGEVVEEVLGQMVDAAVTALTGEADAAKAWGKLFSSDERIGLKPNGLGGPMISTATALIHVCVERLRGVGVKTENLVIWDQDPAKLVACGLEPGETWGVRCVPANAEWDAPTQNGSFAGQITSVLTKQIDGYVNLPIIKDHNLAGVTGALKAHYGSISNPGAHHGNGCDPYIPDLYSIPAVRDKSRLILTDGTRATCEGGPQCNPLFTWNANLILAATDPVAHDMQLWKIIDAQRETNGLPPLEAVGRKPKSILTAAERGLGKVEESRIEVKDLALG
ncbi:MAG: DUF362 domain-containing protein [Armatimonadetes bacterium]|nr:DUF362 domain-containing protein [Armatimonadota bacterium]